MIFGISALFDLPWLANVLSGRPMTLIGLLFLLGLVAFVVRLVRKIGKRQRQPAE
ncbi:hypothetical protein [Streptosporangium minutum]|uniref:hypothetical protein n=1 Tax=Streptosporangium minutum TaxID=569862 RepID=UPI0013FE39AF|nr:hypothetical protein [Streptosporangium minutum]